jgi:hypothetical protein
MFKSAIIVLTAGIVVCGCDRQKATSSQSTEAPAATSAAPAAAPVAPASFAGIAEIFDAVPKDMVPGTKDDWNDLRVAAANSALSSKALNRKITATIKVQNAEITPGGEYAGLPRVIAEQPAGIATPVIFWCYFPKSAVEKLARIHKGDEIKIIGKITYSQFDGNRALTINVNDCDLSPA